MLADSASHCSFSHGEAANKLKFSLRPPEISEPHPRRVLRLVLLAIVIALGLAAIVVVATREPSIRIDRRPVTQINVTNLFESLELISSTCPCQHQDISWCNYTQFYLYKVSNGSNPDESLLDTTSPDILPTLCSGQGEDIYWICETALSPVLDILDTRTLLSTANLLAPSVLYNDIALHIDANGYVQINSYTFFRFMNRSDLFNYSNAMVALTRNMATQFRANTASSAQEFWKASAITRRNYGFMIAFGMKVDWVRYMELCQPVFCDIAERVSIWDRVIQAVAQVGGISTVVVMAVRILLWPAIKFVCRLPAGH